MVVTKQKVVGKHRQTTINPQRTCVVLASLSMRKMEGSLVSLVLTLCLALASAGKQPPDNRVEALELSRVTREVDLTTALAKEKVTLVIENKGNKAINYVLYTVEPQLANHVAYLGAQVRCIHTLV